jgi:hypothetical protein
MHIFARHGDIIVYSGATVPKGATVVENSLLQRGSSDSADHIVRGGIVYKTTDDSAIYVSVEDRAEITHDARHTTLGLPKGIYVVRRMVVATDEGAMPVED